MNSLIAHWPLKGNAGDRTGRHPGAAHDVGYVEGPSPGTGAVRFGPGRSRIEVPTSPGLTLGSRDFTVSAWVRCPAVMRGNFGEISRQLSRRAPDRRLHAFVPFESPMVARTGKQASIRHG